MRRSADCSAARALRARISRSLPDQQRGLTMVEYAVAGALIAAAIVGAFDALGVRIGDLIGFLADAIDV